MHCVSRSFPDIMDFEGCSGRDVIWKMDVEARDHFRKGGRRPEAGSGQRRRWQKGPWQCRHQSWGGHGVAQHKPALLSLGVSSSKTLVSLNMLLGAGSGTQMGRNGLHVRLWASVVLMEKWQRRVEKKAGKTSRAGAEVKRGEKRDVLLEEPRHPLLLPFSITILFITPWAVLKEPPGYRCAPNPSMQPFAPS